MACAIVKLPPEYPKLYPHASQLFELTVEIVTRPPPGRSCETVIKDYY